MTWDPDHRTRVALERTRLELAHTRSALSRHIVPVERVGDVEARAAELEAEIERLAALLG